MSWYQFYRRTTNATRMATRASGGIAVNIGAVLIGDALTIGVKVAEVDITGVRDPRIVVSPWPRPRMILGAVKQADAERRAKGRPAGNRRLRVLSSTVVRHGRSSGRRTQRDGLLSRRRRCPVASPAGQKRHGQCVVCRTPGCGVSKCVVEQCSCPHRTPHQPAVILSINLGTALANSLETIGIFGKTRRPTDCFLQSVSMITY